MPDPEVASVARVSLPTGAQLQAFPTVPIQLEGCSGVTNLQTQIAPFLALIVCQFGIIKLLKPLIEVINALPDPSPRALQEFSKAAASLAPCLQSATPAAVVPFLRDLICLQIRSLNCFLSNLRSVATSMGAHSSTAMTMEIENVLASYEPIVGIMDLAADLFHIAGTEAPRAPTLASDIDAASLGSDQSAVTAYVAALQSLADTLGGC
jgi:hypothetical protein